MYKFIYTFQKICVAHQSTSIVDQQKKSKKNNVNTILLMNSAKAELKYFLYNLTRQIYLHTWICWTAKRNITMKEIKKYRLYNSNREPFFIHDSIKRFVSGGKIVDFSVDINPAEKKYF